MAVTRNYVNKNSVWSRWILAVCACVAKVQTHIFNALKMCVCTLATHAHTASIQRLQTEFLLT